MIDFLLVDRMQNKAYETLQIMLGDNGTPNIEFHSWVIENRPFRSICYREPGNIFMWFDTLSGNWVCFCGAFWKWGGKDSVPEIGSEMPNLGWKEYGSLFDYRRIEIVKRSN